MLGVGGPGRATIVCIRPVANRYATSTCSAIIVAAAIALSSAVALQRCDDRRVIARLGSLQWRGTVRIRSVRIGAIRQQHSDRVALTMQRCDHYGGAAHGVA